MKQILIFGKLDKKIETDEKLVFTTEVFIYKTNATFYNLISKDNPRQKVFAIIHIDKKEKQITISYCWNNPKDKVDCQEMNNVIDEGRYERYKRLSLKDNGSVEIALTNLHTVIVELLQFKSVKLKKTQEIRPLGLVKRIQDIVKKELPDV